MQISLSDTVFEFAVTLAASAKLFTLHQIARHPALAKRTQPAKRASEILRHYPDAFEKFPASFGEPFRFRLSSKEKRKRGLTFKSIEPNTKRAYHWLAMGDLWIALSLYKPLGEPSQQPLIWVSEPGLFDVFCVWRNHAYLFELQRSKLTETEWKKKWEQRKKYFESGAYLKAKWQRADRAVMPEIVLVGNPQQESGTMAIPSWVTWIKDIEDVPRRLILKQDRRK